ncbi:ABC transporter substrate-binding protein [Bradyrhizobium acaciae]|uniref:ABC transporter substrate-binding protein n=1 Tax=Bradyrhizobium acaciae TaxID=2683706 RepID=UPI0030842F38
MSTLSRRSFLTGAAGAFAAPMVLRASSAAANSGSITFTSWGGSFEEAVVKTVTTPFTEETGIKVNLIPTPDLAKLKVQQLTGNVDVDAFVASAEGAAAGSKQGFWEKLDLSTFDVEDMAIPPTSEYVTWDMYAGGIAWDPSKYGQGKHPINFAEYFDVKKFPGRRTFRNRPNETLEAALLADGVAPKNMYPLDVDRAFRVLDRIKPSIASWITATPQTLSLLQTGEVDFSYTYANRVKEAARPSDRKPMAFSFEQNLLGTEKIAIPKGAPNAVNAMKFIAYTVRPEVQARLFSVSPTVPNSKKAMSMLSAEVRKWMPDPNNPNNVVLNGAYWEDNLEAVSRRFKEWVLT